jgi:hypothetical protein
LEDLWDEPLLDGRWDEPLWDEREDLSAAGLLGMLTFFSARRRGVCNMNLSACLCQRLTSSPRAGEALTKLEGVLEGDEEVDALCVVW